VNGIFAGQGMCAAMLDAVNFGVPFITLAVAVAAMFPTLAVYLFDIIRA